MVFLGGWVFLMREVPLYMLHPERSQAETEAPAPYGFISPTNAHPPRTPLGP